MEIKVQELLEDAWGRITKSENLVPLLVGALIVMFGGMLSLGILAAPLMLGFVKMCFRVAGDEPVEIGQISEGFSGFLSAFLIGLLMVVGVIITSCTVIGPLAIVFVCMFAFQILAREESIGAVDALKQSFELVKANMAAAGTVFVINLAINSVLGGGTGILGIPAFAFTTLTTTLLFIRLSGEAHSTAV